MAARTAKNLWRFRSLSPTEMTNATTTRTSWDNNTSKVQHSANVVLLYVRHRYMSNSALQAPGTRGESPARVVGGGSTGGVQPPPHPPQWC